MPARTTSPSYWLACTLTGALCFGCGTNLITNSDGPDSDGDFISDADEGSATERDTDADGTPDYLDADSDGDGVPDELEAGDDDLSTPPVDSDVDGSPDFVDTDADGNGRADGLDGTDDLDQDGVADFADLDDDGDSLLDRTEIGNSPDAPLDSDGDGTPDFRDVDSDNDTVADRDEGTADPDRDGRPAYLDDDSDGDCRLDRVEAGDADLATAPRDYDGDGAPDFLDVDSDRDGVRDSDEDTNCNGALDPGETAADNPDSDSDGASDLVEQVAGTDANDPTDNPLANGDFVFEVPYMAPPTPAEDTLDLSTDIRRADIVFAMDSTGSMLGEINNLKASVANLTNTIRNIVPDTGFAVVGYEDFPVYPYGQSYNRPFYRRHRVMTTNTAAGLASVQERVNTLTTYEGSGADGPESGWEMLSQVATGTGINSGGVSVPAFDPAGAYPAAPPAGEEIGNGGGVGFRAGALPIVIWMTDAPSHNSQVSGFWYAFNGPSNSDLALAQLNSLSARVIGVLSPAGDLPGRTDVQHAVTSTGAMVPPEAWGAPGARPGNCAVGQCCTGLGGAGRGTNAAGLCPLLFDIDGNGNGLGSTVATAVQVLANYTVLDIGPDLADDPSDNVDAVTAFVDHVVANPSGPAPCSQGLSVQDVSPADGVAETFVGVTPGATVCFDVVPRTNTTVPPTGEPQMFRASVSVIGDGVTTLDTRDIYFLVPPDLSPEVN